MLTAGGETDFIHGDHYFVLVLVPPDSRVHRSVRIAWASEVRPLLHYARSRPDGLGGDYVWVLADASLVDTVNGIRLVSDGRAMAGDEGCVMSVPAEWCRFYSPSDAMALAGAMLNTDNFDGHVH